MENATRENSGFGRFIWTAVLGVLGFLMFERSLVFAGAGLIAGAVAVGLLLTACQGAPAVQQSTAPVATSATATPTPQYVPASAKGIAQNVPLPAKAAIADQASKPGLEAFTKYWFALLDYAYQIGDAQPWIANSLPGCDYCTNVKNGIQEVYSADGWMVGARIKAATVDVTTPMEEPTQKVVVKVSQSATQIFRAGKRLSSDSAGDSDVVLLVVRRDGAWVVSNMHPLKIMK